jgi:hypothetical protein
MKLKTQIALTTAAIAAALGSAPAFATTQILSGASASSVNVAKALRTLCVANGGTFKLYKTSSSTSSLGNIFTATCTGADFDSGVDQVRVNVSGGSLGAVTNSTTTAVARIDPAAATCSNIGAGTESLSFMPANEMQNCGATGQLNQIGDGGYLDVSPEVFQANGLSLSGADPEVDFVVSNFFQSFGVAVSSSLYGALQAYQVAKGQLPASCATKTGAGPFLYTATNATTPDCQPSVSRAQIGALINNINNNAKKAGANVLIGGTATVANDLTGGDTISPSPALKTNVTYCRRPNTSGTQASTQLYFLYNPLANGELGGATTVTGPETSGSLTYNTPVTMTSTVNSGSSDVKACLNAAGYSFGSLSAENNPIGGADTYRFVKVNNVSTSGGVAGAAPTAEAIAGRYDFVYQTWKYCPAGTCATILDAIDDALAPGASSPGLFLGTETKFSRLNGKATAPYLQNN